MVKLTKHCCRCNMILLLSGEWLKAVLVRFIGSKETHGYCPKCVDWMITKSRQKRHNNVI